MSRLSYVLIASAILLVGCPKNPNDDSGEDRPQSSSAFVRNLDPGPGVEAVKTLSQNWSEEESNWFYGAPQGSRLLPYEWFLHLEQASSEDLFRDNSNIRRFGYLPRTADANNPDGLPVGFAKDASYAGRIEGLGFTCAACHTGRLDITLDGKTTVFLIDGAPTLADMAGFQRELAEALRATFSNADKFDRFAVALNRASDEGKLELKESLDRIASERQTYNRRNLPAPGAPDFGHGRVDAFGAIMNQVVVSFLNNESNHAAADAPVSYPFIWDAPQHDKVQWNGAAENNKVAILKGFIGTDEVGALGRNTGEVLGVFGFVDPSDQKGYLGGYESSDNRDGLIAIENSLKTLWSPQWPPELGAIETSKAAAGEAIFLQRCNGCHNNSSFVRDDPSRRITAVLRDVGTDQTMASNYAIRSANTGVLEGRRERLRNLVRGKKLGVEEPVSKLLSHMVIRAVIGPESEDVFAAATEVPDYLINYVPYVQVEVNGTVIVGPEDRWEDFALQNFEIKDQDFEVFRQFQFEQDLQSPESQNLDQLQEPRESRDLGQSTDGRFAAGPSPPDASIFADALRLRLAAANKSYVYKARPLNGIWATAPFLHNGSVPNLWELLKSPTAPNEQDRRATRFFVGNTEFDSVNVGFVSDTGPSEFDTTKPGNSSAGHEYGTDLTTEEKLQLIEYVKSL